MKYHWETYALWCLMMSLVQVWIVDKHTLKSSSIVWSQGLFLLFSVFIAEKPASDRCTVEKERSFSVTFFMMMWYSCQRDNQNDVESVDLSFLISISSSSATVNSADLNALNTNRSFTENEKTVLWTVQTCLQQYLNCKSIEIER
jgi:hypothetical protein